MKQNMQRRMTVACAFALIATAASAAVTVLPEELAQKDAWVQQNLLSATAVPPFSFTYGGQSSSAFLPSWTRTAVTNVLDANRTQYTMLWTNAGNALQVRCVAVAYGDYPVVEWMVFLKNIGAADTPILQSIQGLDFKFQRGPASEFVLNGIKGDWCTEDSYQPYSYTLGASSTRSFAPQGTSGKSCDGPSGWPYYNLQMPGGGAILAVGWPGQWASSFARDASTGVVVKAGQELTYLLLHSGEEIRTPLIAILFWQGTDIVRSQNLWRRWYLAHTMPRVNGNLPTPLAQIQIGGAASDTNYAQSFLDAGINVDICWTDANWYKNNHSPYTGGNEWLNTGTWEADPARYPNGFRPYSDWIHGKGLKFVLWFEPERVGDPNSWLGVNHPEWLMSPGSVGTILNEGNPAAFNWLTNHFDNLIKSNGVDWYREDMNGGGPGPTWRANDAGNRQGITENFYVQGHLAFWDALLAMNPGLRIDSCASGGRRNDLETMRRAVPLLRSDYQWTSLPGDIHDGNQCHTYGLSSWLPFQGQGVYQYDSYSFRSFYMTSFGMGGLNSGNKAAQQQAYAECRIVAPCMLYGDYYPLTPYSLANTAWIAWQFDYPERTNGVVQAFRRANSTDPLLTIRLQGLDDQRTYSVQDFDKGDLGKYSGSDLMTYGLTLQLNQRDSAIIRYGPSTGVVVTASSDVRAGRAPLSVAFSAVGTSTDGYPLTYAWTFGDGGTSTATNPSHVYATNGCYTAEVTADDGHGNTDTDRIAISVVSAFVQAEGGHKQYVDLYGANYTIHTFTNSGAANLIVSRGGEVEVLVVAGGGGGGKAESNPGGDGAGGGGAGGLLYIASTSLVAGSHTVVVGTGGNGATNVNSQGDNGSDSSLGALVALGGGGGGSDQHSAKNNGAGGGSGGGAASAHNMDTSGGTGTAGQGRNGGSCTGAAADPWGPRGGGGGGGAKGQGASEGSQNYGCAGGDGTNCSITGAFTLYAGGGGGGSCGNTGGGYGGAGGGGAGGNNGAAGTAGTANTGGGGGGGGSPAVGNISGAGGAGGSGILMVRYLTGPADAPGIENRPVSNVTTGSATFNGSLSATGGSACAVCVLWGETNGGQTWNWSHTNWFEGTGWTNNTPFSTNLAAGIAANRTYWYTFAATNATATAVASAPKSFITGEVTVRATDSEAQYPGNPGQFTIHRPPGCTNEALTVNFTIGGTAVENTDYTLSPSGGATLDVGATSKVVNLTATIAGHGTAILKLTQANGNAYPVGADSNATVTIQAATATDVAATGGSVTNYTLNGTNFTAHLFTTAGTTSLTVTAGGDVEVLVVGGGGGGGSFAGGGGGGGGVIYTSAFAVVAGSNYAVTVGAGGNSSPPRVTGTNGGDSAFGPLIAAGGGGGAGQDTYPAANGGSGGGGQGGTNTGQQPGTNNATLGISPAGTGNTGGAGYKKGGAGGGGGAAAAGAAGTSGAGGNGGQGLTNSISGVPVIYGSGGGGGKMVASGTAGPGGTGAGSGSVGNTSPGSAGNATGYGCGGGGSGGIEGQWNNGYPGGSGFQGIVIVRYVTSPYELWRRAHFTAGELADPEISGDDADPDHDGLNNAQEFLAGTDPMKASSCLAITGLTNNPAVAGGGFVVSWQSVSGKTYSVLAATNLLTGFSALTNALRATPTVNVYTDSVNGAAQKFYRVGVE